MQTGPSDMTGEGDGRRIIEKSIHRVHQDYNTNKTSLNL